MRHLLTPVAIAGCDPDRCHGCTEGAHGGERIDYQTNIDLHSEQQRRPDEHAYSTAIPQTMTATLARSRLDTGVTLMGLRATFV